MKALVIYFDDTPQINVTLTMDEYVHMKYMLEQYNKQNAGKLNIETEEKMIEITQKFNDIQH